MNWRTFTSSNNIKTINMSVPEKIKELRGKLEYINNILLCGDAEPWESKEYESLQIRYIIEIQELEELVRNNPEIF